LALVLATVRYRIVEKNCQFKLSLSYSTYDGHVTVRVKKINEKSVPFKPTVD